MRTAFVLGKPKLWIQLYSYTYLCVAGFTASQIAKSRFKLQKVYKYFFLLFEKFVG